MNSTEWIASKHEAREFLVEIARSEEGIPVSYTELCKHIKALPFTAQSELLGDLLTEISADEDEKGRGLLSVLVVHKEDEMPGQRFFNEAKKRGRDISDKTKCWAEELTKVLAYWRSHPR
jgi:hypothetical protein